MKHPEPLPPGWNKPVYTVTFCSFRWSTVTTRNYDGKFAAIKAARAYVKRYLKDDKSLTYRGIDNGFQVTHGFTVVAKATFEQTKKAQPSCDCSNHERQVCNICQGIQPIEIVPGDVDNLTFEEVMGAIKSIHRMSPLPDGPGVEPLIDFSLRCQAEVDKIEEKGWKLGLSLDSHMQIRTKNGGHKWLLKSPRKVFQVVAAFYDRANPASKVLFHISDCATKREALERISRRPAPSLKQLHLSGI